MSEYRPPTGSEAETEPGSRGRVLRNLPGIRSKRAMDQAEYEALLIAQEAYLHRITSETRFTSRLLREMHRDWLDGLYPWAGQYRTVEMSKGGFQWPPAFRVGPNMENFETGKLHEHTPCRPASLSVVTRRMAEVHGDLLLIHPFREGNGRLARWLADLMAFQAGYTAPDYGFQGRGARERRARYLRAVQQAYLEDYSDLSDFFRWTLDPRLRGSG